MVDINTGQLIGTALGGTLAIAGGAIATVLGSRSARALAAEQREAAKADARATYLVDSLLELQVATVHLMRALAAYEEAIQAWLRDGAPDDVPDRQAVVYGPLIESMAHVQILALRLEGEPGVDAAMVLRASAGNLINYDPLLAPDQVQDDLDHILDEGITHGVAALEELGERLRGLPGPSTYRPLGPWSVRPPSSPT